MGGLAPVAATTMVPSAMFHPHHSTDTGALVECLVNTWKRSFPVYLSLSLAPAVTLHLGSIRRRPWTILRPFVSAARSALFLGTFCSVYYAVALAYRAFSSATARDNKYLYYLAGWVCGWSVLLEKKSRRAELALYVLPRAADSFYQIMLDRKWMASLPFGEVLIFGGSMGVIVHCYYHRPNTV